MDAKQKQDFAARGVVRNGYVVLDAPLDAPDGTVVTIRRCEDGDIPAVGVESARRFEEELRWIEEDIAWLTARAARQAADKQGRPKAA